MRPATPSKELIARLLLQPLLLAVLALAALTPNATAAEHWIRVTTPHFDMYTTNSEKQAIAALQVFEQVRYFFLQTSHSKVTANTPVRVIAFRSEKEYKPYRFNEGAFAYYVRSRKADYIVMQDITPENYRAAVHEYTHLIVEHLGLTLPLWLNEGMADLYSSLEARGNQAIVGRPIPSHVQQLLTQRWLDLNSLFQVGPDSPYYNERDKMSIFYAESWALTHMLELGENYRADFPRFLAAIVAGHPAPDCFQAIYGKSLAQVIQDLHYYIRRSSVQGAIFDVKLNNSDLEPNVSEPSEFTLDVVLTDLLASQKKAATEAQNRLLKLAADHPESPEVYESLAFLAWQQGNVEKATANFKLATEKGSKNPQVLFDYSVLLRESGGSSDEVISLLQRAVAIKPDYADAWFNLGMTATNARQYSVALDALSHIKTVTPDRAYSLFSAIAFCYLQEKKFTDARDAADRAKQYAKAPDQQQQVSNLIHAVDMLEQRGARSSQSATSASFVASGMPDSSDRPTVRHSENRDIPPATNEEASQTTPQNPANVTVSGLPHVDAIPKFFDCSSSTPRLRVTVNGKEMVFAFDDPKGVIVRSAGQNSTIDMHCGPQKPVHVEIFYAPNTPGTHVDGLIRELVF